MGRPLTPAELKLREGVQSTETIVQVRFWRLRPDDIAFRHPPNKDGHILYPRVQTYE